MADHTENFAVKVGSDKSFGIVFSLVFGIVGVWPLFDGGLIRYWAIGASAVFLLLAFVKPEVMRPLNKMWFLLGIYLGKIVTPIVLGALYFTTVTPIGLLMRAAGKDGLRLKIDPKQTTYWIERPEPGPGPGSMRNQF